MTVALPDPGTAAGLDDIAALLRELKSRAGDPSFDAITGIVNGSRPPELVVGRTTVVDCFRPGRRRVDQELVAAVVAALHPDPGYVNRWRRSLRDVVAVADAAHLVRVLDVLPDDPPDFVGRDGLLGELRRAAAGTSPLVVAAQGMAGAGKTHLAVRFGHVVVREHAVEQVLFVDLRGFHESQPPADPSAVLEGFLRLLGVPGQSVPKGLDARAALFRERLSARRALVVLDNAADIDQVRPLVPGVPGCVVVVTSRRDLALEGAVRVEVGAFTGAESRRYLSAAAGGDDRDALDRIAERYGHLPLALALIAGQMRRKPRWTPADHAEWAEQHRASDLLDSHVKSALDLSYRALSDPGRRLLRLLGLHLGQSFGLGTAAALAGADAETVRATIGELDAQHLVQRTAADRFTLHDLVRAFATDRAVDEERRAERRAAVSRLLDYYLAAVAADLDRVYPARATRQKAADAAWLDAEMSNLVATTQLTSADHDRPGYAVELSALLHEFLKSHAYGHAPFAIHGRAVLSAQQHGDLSGQAYALARIATAEIQAARYHDAVAHLDDAERLFARNGDEAGRRLAVMNRSITNIHLGRLGTARPDLLWLVEHDRRAGDERNLMYSLNTLGSAEFIMGLAQEAAGRFEETSRLAERLGDDWMRASALSNIAGADIELGRLDAAQGLLDRALPLMRELGHKGSEGAALDVAGNLHAARGQYPQAAVAYRRAIELLREAGLRYAEFSAVNGLGDVALATGDLDAAAAEYTTAYEGASAPEVGNREQQARAQAGLGEVARRRGDPAAARTHDTLARELWSGINDAKAAALASSCR